jgi:hydrogenase maturation protein HypF
MGVQSIATDRTALRLQLLGRVQGYGVRPAVARLAEQVGLAGSVRNTLEGLEIEIEGLADDVALFQSLLLAVLPAGCDVREQIVAPIPDSGRDRFLIACEVSDGALATLIPPDTAVCSECLAESRSCENRRSGYALISCAACGPRYTVIRSMPYERGDTSLSRFPPCPACAAEYATPADRRIHAQTIA